MNRRFLIVAHTARKRSVQALFSVVKTLHELGITPVISAEEGDGIERAINDDPTWLPDGMSRDLTTYGIRLVEHVEDAEGLELAVVLGGDGTILRAIESVRSLGIPVHGINLGHVGFLAESEPGDLSNTVERLVAADYSVEERTTLAATVWDGERKVADAWALNEIAIEKADRQKLINVAIEIDGRPVSSFGCDGVLLATPTGSTAYAFSAGGPVVWPEVEALMFIPLSAHALFARPLVVGPTSQIAIEITADTTSGAVLWADGRRMIELRAGHRVEARRSESSVKIARFAAAPFADRLVSRFHLPVTGWRGRDLGADSDEQPRGE